MPVPKRQQSLLIGWLTDGIDHCRVGFLPRHLVCSRAHFYSGPLVQVVEMLADSENPRQRQYSRHNLGAWKAPVMIDTLVDDNVAANGLRSCCMDDISQSTMQEGETKNDDKNKEFLSAQEEEGRIKRL